MEEKEYSVSEAVRLIGVESHVLRYWEEELPIEIRRNAQGHRLYSEENIDTLRQVKSLKEKGLQLKAIRLLLDGQGRLDLGAQDSGFVGHIRGLAGENKSEGSCAETIGEHTSEESSGETIRENTCGGSNVETAGDIVVVREPEPVQRFEQILRRLMEEVVAEQNGRLEETIAARMREELEQFCLQYEQIALEAAAALEAEGRKSGVLRRALRKLFRRE